MSRTNNLFFVLLIGSFFLLICESNAKIIVKAKTVEPGQATRFGSFKIVKRGVDNTRATSQANEQNARSKLFQPNNGNANTTTNGSSSYNDPNTTSQPLDSGPISRGINQNLEQRNNTTTTPSNDNSSEGIKGTGAPNQDNPDLPDIPPVNRNVTPEKDDMAPPVTTDDIEKINIKGKQSQLKKKKYKHEYVTNSPPVTINAHRNFSQYQGAIPNNAVIANIINGNKQYLCQTEYQGVSYTGFMFEGNPCMIQIKGKNVAVKKFNIQVQ